MKRVCLEGIAVVLVSLMWVGVPSAGASPGESDPQRLWIRSLDDDGRSGVILHVTYKGEQDGDGDVAFDCEVLAEAEMGDTEVTLTILDAEGRPLEAAEVSLKVVAGSNRCHFDWSTKDLPDGDYTIRFDYFRTPGQTIAWAELGVVKLSRSKVQKDFWLAVEAVESLMGHVKRLGEGFPRSPYLKMRLAFANDFIHGVNTEQDDWRRIHHMTSYARDAVDSVRLGIALTAVAPELTEPVRSADLGKLVVENGSFQAGGRPVFLAGVWSKEITGSDLARLRRYGLNLAVIEKSLTPPLDEEALRAEFSSVLQSARENNISLSYLLSFGEDESGGRVGIVPPETGFRSRKEIRNYIAPRLRTFIDHLAGQEMLNSLSLAHKPAFQFAGESVRAGFIKEIKSSYIDRYALNRAWRSRFRDFDEVDIWPDYPRSSYQYDWQIYNRELGSRYLSEIADFVHEIDPHLRLQLTYDGNAFEKAESRYGIDHENLAMRFPLSGISSPTGFADPVYAMPYPGQSLLLVLQSSLGPGSPVFQLQEGMVEPGESASGDLFALVHGSAWDGAIEGANAFALLGGEGRDGASESFLARPEAFEGLATACLDLNRLGDIVTAFQQSRAEVGILWSDSSKIYADGDPYLGSAARAYEGCSFAGRKLRFVTESQCGEGALADLAMLIIPNTPALSDAAFEAVQQFADAGGTIIRSATPIPYDEWGHSRKDVITYGLSTLLVRGRDSSTEYLHAMDAALSMGMVRDVPRTTNEFGYPLEGVKTRYVELDGQAYLYLMNLRKEPVECYLRGGVSSGRDLIRGSDVRFPAVVAPLRPLLIRLDSPGPGTPGTSSIFQVLAPETGAPGEVPAARVEPLVAAIPPDSQD